MIPRPPLLKRTYARLDSERRGAHWRSSWAFMEVNVVNSKSNPTARWRSFEAAPELPADPLREERVQGSALLHNQARALY